MFEDFHADSLIEQRVNLVKKQVTVVWTEAEGETLLMPPSCASVFLVFTPMLIPW